MRGWRPPRTSPPRPRPPTEEPITTALAIDPLRLELGYGLLPLISEAGGPPAHRPDQGAAPPARRRARLRHAAGAHPGQHPAAGQHLRRQAQGDRGRARRAAPQPCCWSWIPRAARSACPARRPPSRPSACRRCGSSRDLREEASFRGYTVVDPATVITTHLTEIIKDNLAELLTYAETQKLLDELVQGLPEADRRPGAAADQRRRHPARAADPARRAHLDPRPAADPRGDRRSRQRHPERRS